MSNTSIASKATDKATDENDSATPVLPPSYYAKGSVELAIETPVMRKRLEKRRTLTNGSRINDTAIAPERLLIVLVGLPARGKSFIARKLLNYMVWRTNQCRIFNVGKYRREVTTSGTPVEGNGVPDADKSGSPEDQSLRQQKADFFDDKNETAARLRQEAAHLALQDTLAWLEDSTSETLDDNLSSGEESVSSDPYFKSRLSYSERRKFHRIAIFDATNSTRERRDWILQECAKADEINGANTKSHRKTGVLFLESICDDDELLQENFQVKISSCPDFANMNQEEALSDLKTRIEKYESRYETLESQSHQSYIKIFNLSSRLMVNHVYGRLAKVVLPAIMAWNTGSRPIYLCRPGETKAMEDYMKQQEQGSKENVNNRTQRKRGDRLGERGFRFQKALSDFIAKEGMEFAERQNHKQNHKIDTGTSIAGLYEERDHIVAESMMMESPHKQKQEQRDYHDDSEHDEHGHLPFPCLVMSSTLPRAVETASLPAFSFPVKDVTNLNPLDMGDFTGMDLATIRDEHPVWYAQLQREPFYTRFPGGESYADLIDRLYSIVIDMEQQLGLAVAVSHVSVIQVLLSYFRSSPIQKCIDIEVPMHTVFKFVPLRGGGWLESQHVLMEDDVSLKPSAHQNPTAWNAGEKGEDVPIWGDSRSCLPQRLDSL